MEIIIDPVEKNILEAELSADKFIRDTNNGDNQIFVITHHDSPNVMRDNINMIITIISFTNKFIR